MKLKITHVPRYPDGPCPPAHYRHRCVKFHVPSTGHRAEVLHARTLSEALDAAYVDMWNMSECQVLEITADCDDLLDVVECEKVWLHKRAA